MRLANHGGRAVLLTSDEYGYDVNALSNGAFGPDIASVYANWEAFQSWAAAVSPNPASAPIAVSRAELGPPSPSPRQVIAIGLNYSAHAAESGFAAPEGLPPTFTKFASSLTGPDIVVALPDGGHTDWEVELVVVIGREARDVDPTDAWRHVAGLTVGQDLSERITQMAAHPPQFSLGKSFPGFAPTGPWLVTPDELTDPDALGLECRIDGEVMQKGNTSDLIFPVPQLVAHLSRIITLHPGDVIFTGTPEGVGIGRSPQRFLQDGETLTSRIDGIGELRQQFVVATAQGA